MKLAIEGCKIVAPRSCREVEYDCLSLLQHLYKKPTVPLGLLPPQAAEERGSLALSENNGSHGSEAKIMEWIDKQTPRSVVYVAFGSEATLSTEQLHELALGLQLSKVPFLWALRIRPDQTAVLPEGFEDGTKDNGMVVMGWVPQLKVLAHESVGCFLTHSGWSSIIENFQYGHPLVLLPITLDQGLNARVMEEKGVGFEVERNEEDGSFTRENVAKAVRLVMVDEEGGGYRSKAREMTKVFADKELHEKYVDDFIEYLRNQRNHEG